jgi:hypothetical protein
MFQIIGAMAEFERSLIQERVRAGLRNAKLRGKTLGRPPLALDCGRIARLRDSGVSIRAISAQLGVRALCQGLSFGKRSSILQAQLSFYSCLALVRRVGAPSDGLAIPVIFWNEESK